MKKQTREIIAELIGAGLLTFRYTEQAAEAIERALEKMDCPKCSKPRNRCLCGSF